MCPGKTEAAAQLPRLFLVENSPVDELPIKKSCSHFFSNQLLVVVIRVVQSNQNLVKASNGLQSSVEPVVILIHQQVGPLRADFVRINRDTVARIGETVVEADEA